MDDKINRGGNSSWKLYIVCIELGLGKLAIRASRSSQNSKEMMRKFAVVENFSSGPTAEKQILNIVCKKDAPQS